MWRLEGIRACPRGWTAFQLARHDNDSPGLTTMKSKDVVLRWVSTWSLVDDNRSSLTSNQRLFVAVGVPVLRWSQRISPIKPTPSQPLVETKRQYELCSLQHPKHRLNATIRR